MQSPVRLSAILFATIAGYGISAAPAAAQDWPSKPVKIIVPFPPGQATDTLARLVAEKLTTALGQPFIIDNRPGAGGVVGTEAAKYAAPDG